MGCRALLQGIFPTQSLNSHLTALALADGFFTTSTAWEAQVGLNGAQAVKNPPAMT